MAATGTRLFSSWWNCYICPLTCCEIIDGHFIGPCSLLEPSKNDHLLRVWIKDSCMLIPQPDIIASCLRDAPGHCFQIEPVDISTEFSIFIRNPVVVAAKEPHIIIVHYRGMISYWARLIGALSLHLPPFMATHQTISIFVN